MIVKTDLAAIRYNVNLIKKVTGKKLLLPVKADGYGHGLKKTVLATKDAVEGFWTATPEEALAVKKYASKPVIVACALEKDYKKLVNAGVEMCVNRAEEYRFIKKTAEHLNKCARVHISIDTCMKRMGFSQSENFDFLSNEKSVKVLSAHTHFSLYDKDFIKNITNRFYNAAQKIKEKLPYKLKTHLFASGATETYLKSSEKIPGDYIRAGLICYGVERFFDLGVRPALSVCCKVIAVNKASKGDAVGYGGRWKLQEDGYVFTAEGGYFDGIFPSFVGGSVEINKKKCKIIAVCMDCFMVFCKNLIAKKGDSVYVLNDNITVKDIAAKQNKSPYEILTSFKGRIERKYNE